MRTLWLERRCNVEGPVRECSVMKLKSKEGISWGTDAGKVAKDVGKRLRLKLELRRFNSHSWIFSITCNSLINCPLCIRSGWAVLNYRCVLIQIYCTSYQITYGLNVFRMERVRPYRLIRSNYLYLECINFLYLRYFYSFYLRCAIYTKSANRI